MVNGGQRNKRHKRCAKIVADLARDRRRTLSRSCGRWLACTVAASSSLSGLSATHQQSIVNTNNTLLHTRTSWYLHLDPIMQIDLISGNLNFVFLTFYHNYIIAKHTYLCIELQPISISFVTLLLITTNLYNNNSQTINIKYRGTTFRCRNRFQMRFADRSTYVSQVKAIATNINLFGTK